MIPLEFSPEAAEARRDGMPLVALESSIIVQGLPAPLNLETAAACETAIREAGAVPATVAAIDGRLHVGLTNEQLLALSRTEGARKLSRADLPVCLATGGTGATTVAATMIAARMAEIEVFATGGIGGVHRGAETTFDISADLDELAQTPVTVVSAGVKAILDIPKTLEALETRGVPVIAFGQDAMPAFWSRDCGIPAPLRLDDPREIALAHRARREMGLPGGQLVANPIPVEEEIPRAEIESAVADATKDARLRGIGGKSLTPFLLSRIRELTSGRSLKANAALARNNARLAARIALHLAR